MLSFVLIAACLGADAAVPLTLEAIHIRDPFVLPVAGEQRYYLYGTGSPLGEKGFDAYRSPDLKHWEGPFAVMRPPKDFWADRHFWAPEVHEWRGKYYLFATFAREYPVRGTQICVSDSPEGPFQPLGDGPQTPRDWQCLDGTLYIDPQGAPWMVFCHEWTQVGDGEICAIALSDDLSESVGEPKVLFRASEVTWGGVSKHERFEGRVTDGPFLHRLSSGALVMLWSTFNGKLDYCVAIARSETGSITGPWKHDPQPFFKGDGGHPMLFRTFDGKLTLSIHQPNKGRRERARFIPVTDAQLEAGKL